MTTNLSGPTDYLPDPAEAQRRGACGDQSYAS